MVGTVTLLSNAITETGTGTNVPGQTKVIGPLNLVGSGNTVGVQDIALINGQNLINSPVGATWVVVILTANPNSGTIALSSVISNTVAQVANPNQAVQFVFSFANPNQANSFSINANQAGMTISVSYW